MGSDGVEDIELDVIGFEYGVCEKIAIDTDVLGFAVYFLPNRGVHKIILTDKSETH